MRRPAQFHDPSDPTAPRERVLVVGDCMLDRTHSGSVERISPEAPVPVLRVAETTDRPGGAANVAVAARALGADVAIAGVVGRDEAAAVLARLLREESVDCQDLVASPDAITTLKNRLRSGHHQLARYDIEMPLEPDSAALDRLAGRIAAAVNGADGVVLSDYAKGVCSPGICRGVIDAARRRGVPVVVDPKAADLSRYARASVITPNRAEAARATGRPIHDHRDAIRAAEEIRAAHAIDGVVVTLGSGGLVAVDRTGPTVLPAVARQVYDVTGAGDTVAAAIAVSLAGGLPLQEACRLATLAAGLKVSRIGTAAVGRAELIAAATGSADAPRALRERPPAPPQGLSGLEAVVADVAAARGRGLTIGFTNGCFDLLHRGHVALLEAAARECDRLVVGLNADQSVRRLKGGGRPFLSLPERAAVLAGLRSVWRIVAFEEDTPLALIRAIRPDVLVKGGDYDPGSIVGGSEVLAAGGRILTPLFVDGVSTSRIADRIAARAAVIAPGTERRAA